MKKSHDDMQDIMARMDRLESGLGIQIDRFIASGQVLSKTGKELMLDVEELKAVKHSLEQDVPKTLEESLKESAKVLIPKLLPPLTKGFQEATDEFIKSSLGKGEKLKDEIDDSISKVQRLVDSHKREITLRRFGLTIVFCASSLLTAVGFHYYFPQHQYIYYQMDQEMAHSLIFGEVLLENFKKLAPEQQEFFLDKANRKIRSAKGSK